jgi:hypothetical protein
MKVTVLCRRPYGCLAKTIAALEYQRRPPAVVYLRKPCQQPAENVVALHICGMYAKFFGFRVDFQFVD